MSTSVSDTASRQSTSYNNNNHSKTSKLTNHQSLDRPHKSKEEETGKRRLKLSNSVSDLLVLSKQQSQTESLSSTTATRSASFTSPSTRASNQQQSSAKLQLLQVQERSSSTALNTNANQQTSSDSTTVTASISNDGNIPLRYAGEKRNIDFHLMFRSVPEWDGLIEDYSAAYQREILIHGRVYISRRHICFNSRIFGWVTNLVISFSDVVSIERRMTALVIPNAILITTQHSKFFFASFLFREQTFSMLYRLWRSALGESVDGIEQLVSADLLQNNLQVASTLTPPPIAKQLTDGDVYMKEFLNDNTDTPEVVHTVDEFSGSDELTDDEGEADYMSVGDYAATSAPSTILKDGIRNAAHDLNGAVRQRQHTLPLELTSIHSATGSDTTTDSDATSPVGESRGAHSDSGLLVKSPKHRHKWHTRLLNELIPSRMQTKSSLETIESQEAPFNSVGSGRLADSVSTNENANDVLISVKRSGSGRKKHSPLQTKSKWTHNKPPRPPVFCNCRDHCKSVIIDRIYPISVSSMASLLFASKSFMEKVYRECGFENVTMNDWEKSDGIERRKIEYSVPIKILFVNGNTPGYLTQRYVRKEANSVFCVRDFTSTPRVPGGTTFNSLASICIMRITDNSTRVIVAFEVEFIKNFWLKQQMEKSAMEGNIAFWRTFETMLVDECKSISVKLSANDVYNNNNTDTDLSPTQSPDSNNTLPGSLLSDPQILAAKKRHGQSVKASAIMTLPQVLMDIMQTIWNSLMEAASWRYIRILVPVMLVGVNLLLWWKNYAVDQLAQEIIGAYSIENQPIPDWWSMEITNEEERMRDIPADYQSILLNLQLNDYHEGKTDPEEFLESWPYVAINRDLADKLDHIQYSIRKLQREQQRLQMLQHLP